MYTGIGLSVFAWRAFPLFRFHSRAPRGTELYVAQLSVLGHKLNYGDNALCELCDNSRETAPVTHQQGRRC